MLGQECRIWDRKALVSVPGSITHCLFPLSKLALGHLASFSTLVKWRQIGHLPGLWRGIEEVTRAWHVGAPWIVVPFVPF